MTGSGALWSPDGTRIAFTRDGEPSGTQIWVRWMDADSAATQITHLEQSPSNITWSPDGKSIAFTMLVPKRETWPIRMPGRPEGAKWTEAPRIVESLTYRADRQGFIDQGLDQIYIVPAEGGTAYLYGKSQLALFRLDSQNKWFSTQNMCPHKREMVLARGLVGDKDGLPKVACPIHKKSFDLESGRCLNDDTLGIVTFPVKVENGAVLVELPPEAELEAALKASECDAHCATAAE